MPLCLLGADRLDHTLQDLPLFATVRTQHLEPRVEILSGLPVDLAIEHGRHPAQVFL